MAGALHYDHPNFVVRWESTHLGAIAPAASATDFAQFRVKQKCLVKAIHVIVDSVSGSLPTIVKPFKNGTSIGYALTITAGVSTGSLPGTLASRVLVTLASSNTLASIGDLMSLRQDTAEGQYMIIYEYELIPGGFLT